MESLFEAVEKHDLTPTHVLLTHHHYDHVCELDKILERWPDIAVLIHPLEEGDVEKTTGTVQPGEIVEIGDLRFEALHTPGHTAGMISFFLDNNQVFTGDTLFKNSVGGVRAPGHTTFADIKQSIMETLMGLDHAVEIRPGHTDPTTVRRGGGRPTRSSASGAAWTRRATSPARRSTSPPPSSSWATTTTAATRRGSAGSRAARTTSSPARRSRGRATKPPTTTPLRPRRIPERRLGRPAVPPTRKGSHDPSYRPAPDGAAPTLRP